MRTRASSSTASSPTALKVHLTAKQPEPKPIRFKDASEWERDTIILPLQSLRKFDIPTKLLGWSVQGESLLVLFACLYWAVDQYKCYAGIWLVPVSEVANGLIKWVTQRPRPLWEDERVQTRGWSSEYSFPSSHSQLAMALATFFVLGSAHEQAVTSTSAMIAFPLALCVGLSRIHAGLHYPSDVAVGWFLGALTAAAYCAALPTLLSISAALSFGTRAAALCVPTLLTAAALVATFRAVRATHAPLADAWRRNASRGKYAKRELDPLNVPFGAYMGMVGVLAGLSTGESLMHRYPLPYPASASHAALRCVVGNIGLLVCFEGIAALTPKRPLALYSTLRFVKYAIVPVYILQLAPCAFEHFGI